jgi:hypothetical protein
MPGLIQPLDPCLINAFPPSVIKFFGAEIYVPSPWGEGEDEGKGALAFIRYIVFRLLCNFSNG